MVAQESSCFLSVTWPWRALYGLGGQGVTVLLLLGGFFLPAWLQCLSKIFDLQSSHCLLPPSSHHLGSSFIYLLEDWDQCIVKVKWMVSKNPDESADITLSDMNLFRLLVLSERIFL
jgi:hypothetical protein